MSVRYSGDAEIRIGYDAERRVYRGNVVDPNLRFRGWVPVRRARRDEKDQRPSSPRSSAAYDDAARRLATAAQRWARDRGRRFAVEQDEKGRIEIRRVFQSPCPLEDL